MELFSLEPKLLISVSWLPSGWPRSDFDSLGTTRFWSLSLRTTFRYSSTGLLEKCSDLGLPNVTLGLGLTVWKCSSGFWCSRLDLSTGTACSGMSQEYSVLGLSNGYADLGLSPTESKTFSVPESVSSEVCTIPFWDRWRVLVLAKEADDK